MAVDPKASKIEFSVALPKVWNGKAVLFGGGGLDGVVADLTDTLPAGPPHAPTPLARGYASYTSDGGHQTRHEGAGLQIDRYDGDFLKNEEERDNYFGNALKKTHDAAFMIIRRAYGRSPSRSYVTGGSKGGAEALAAVRRWPLDYDGAVALYPARNFLATILNMTAVSQALSAPGAYLDLPARGLLHRAALEACDGLDGAKDGLISNVRQCNKVFDPATATVDGSPLRCGDQKKDCLSNAQIATLKNINAGARLGFTLADGTTRLPGFNIYEADIGGVKLSPFTPLVAMLTIGVTPASAPPAAGNSMAARFSDIFLRYQSGNDSFDFLKFRLHQSGPLAKRIGTPPHLSTIDPDFSTFAARGGKLILVQGTDDMLVSPRATEDFIKQIRAKVGRANTSAFLRYYEIPGFGHFFNTDFNAAWDRLSALDDWVEKGVDPANKQVAVDVVGDPGRTRPICLYPTFPRYKGVGDIRSAASFSCSAE